MWAGKLGLIRFSKFSTLEMSTHVALQLAPKPHEDRWHQPRCLLQAAWLVQRCLSIARGARHQAKAIALPFTPQLLSTPPLSSLQHPPASSFHLYEGLEQPHENIALRRLDKSSSKPGWLHGASRYISLNTLTVAPSPAICLSIKPGWELHTGKELFVFDEIERPLIAGGLVQIWCVHPGPGLRAKQCRIVLRMVDGAAGKAAGKFL